VLPPNTNPGSKRKKRFLICLVIGFAAFIFILRPAGFLTGLWLSERQKRAERTPQVKVPNVVGQDYRRGEAILKEKGLRMRVLAKRWDQNQPVDIILDQVPFGSENVDLGYTVGVTVGAQPPPETFPAQR
jgi:beta-lactam-binding protein with PASTA domain